MRLAMIAALAVVAVVGCSAGSGDCFPSTCPDGCCGADGLCHAGTSSTECGSRANSCVDCSAAGQFCGTDQFCHAPGTGSDAGVDAGSDAGMDGGTLFVTMRYRYEVRTSSETCPQVYEATLCSDIATMTPAEFSALRLEYPDCDVSQTDVDGREIDCSGNCGERIETCSNMSTGMASEVTRYDCAIPKFAADGECAWNP